MRRAHTILGLLLVLLIGGAASRAHAEPAVAVPEERAHRDDVQSAAVSSVEAPAQDGGALRVVLALSVLLGVTALGLAMYWSRRQRRRPVASGPLTTWRPLRQLARPRPPGERLITTTAITATPDGAFETIESRTLLVVPAMSAVPGIKVCLHCQREFDAMLERCPFDEHALVTRGSGGLLQHQRDGLDGSVAQMVCPRCRRRYELGAHFCPHDGHRCERQQVQAPDTVNVIRGRVCPTCGDERGPDVTRCARDGALLLPRINDPDQPVLASHPVLFCARCHAESPLGRRRCAQCDGDALLVLSGRRTVGLPSTGLGPRTRICPECGERHATRLRYCARDGNRLMTIN